MMNDMIHYHPSINTLTEYAAGSLDTAAAIAVSAHLYFCPHCRQQVERLQVVGGTLIEQQQASAAISPDLLDQVLQRIDQLPETEPPTTKAPAPRDQALAGFPPVVAKLIGNRRQLQWKKLTSALQIASLETGQSRSEVSLHRINAGGKVLEHDHRGLEYTLVLKGSFSDENGVYHPGDFLMKQPGEVHRPYAAANRDCICLTVVEAPVRFTGFWGLLLNPFLKLNPA